MNTPHTCGMCIELGRMELFHGFCFLPCMYMYILVECSRLVLTEQCLKSKCFFHSLYQLLRTCMYILAKHARTCMYILAKHASKAMS